ncbi:Coiled-coil domain-containing protein 65 isoform X2 [Oopsacas minuta]|uniref:Dynein regulatory complex subunit 2 n=1 Tax=Oopsacas minuta TaxID=111878 RepID=A0AAV7JP54_9METZ|nr:Coiled-coil domain-containing protein 65 isoform X2 [Oopsacas minuta]
MPKKKDKLKNMTEEERVEYLHQKQLEEEEILKNQERALLDFLKEKVIREEKCSKLNTLKLQEKWRMILRGVKTDGLRQEIEVVKQKFERVVDNKGAILQALSEELLEAEEQYMMAHRSHLCELDKLYDLQKRRLNALDKDFDDQLEHLQSDYQLERNSMEDKHKKQQQYWHEVMYAMQLRQEERVEAKKKEYQSSMDEIKNKQMDSKHALKDQKNEEFQALVSVFNHGKEEYRRLTEDKKSNYENLKSQDILNSEKINKQMKTIQRFQDNINSIRGTMDVNSKEHKTESSAMRENKEMVVSSLRDLKSYLGRERERERKDLMKLTMQTSRSAKRLRELKDKGGKVLRLSEICRKKETEEEKVLPFYQSSLTQEEEAAIKSLTEQQPREELSKVLEDYKAMENFWKRVNKVTLDVHALEKEKEKLSIQNHKLRTMLKQYLEGISVSDDVMSRANPLMQCMTSPLTYQGPMLGDKRRLPAPITVVEAAHVVKNTI